MPGTIVKANILTSHFQITGALLCRVMLGVAVALALACCQNGDDLPYCEEIDAEARELLIKKLQPYRSCETNSDCVRIANAKSIEDLQRAGSPPEWSCAFWGCAAIPAVNRANLQDVTKVLNEVTKLCMTECTLKNPGVVVDAYCLGPDDLQCKAGRCFPARDERADQVEETDAGTK